MTSSARAIHLEAGGCGPIVVDRRRRLMSAPPNAAAATRSIAEAVSEPTVARLARPTTAGVFDLRRVAVVRQHHCT